MFSDKKAVKVLAYKFADQVGSDVRMGHVGYGHLLPARPDIIDPAWVVVSWEVF